ncbi:MAG: HesB/IscA family protein [Planctomycetota bacterium]
MPVTVTDTAAREICNIIKQQGLDAEKVRLRVGVKGGGCSGFSYLLDLTETERSTDEIWAYNYVFQPAGAAEAGGEAGVAVAEGDGGGDGGDDGPFTIKVVCDPKSYLYLNGTVIDFKDELMGRGFVFSNPNATSTCGCGSSFSA